MGKKYGLKILIYLASTAGLKYMIGNLASKTCLTPQRWWNYRRAEIIGVCIASVPIIDFTKQNRIIEINDW